MEEGGGGGRKEIRPCVHILSNEINLYRWRKRPSYAPSPREIIGNLPNTEYL